MTLGITHLVHANVVCADFDRSFDFYTRVLGARLIGRVFEFDAAADFQAILDVTGSVRCKAALLTWSDDDAATYLDLLCFADERGEPVPRTAKQPGLARLGLRVRDMTATLARIREHDVPVVAGPVTLTPMPGRHRHVLTIRDPDGTMLNLMEFPELGSGRG
ncbi:VOC family protein [Nonomuraea sp. C10]|uniref:VOC family protein n=1 Tax=Nonomuraea sp. C10 TaxID=2600577 RepID=UPI0011CD6A22|nr:VOC family protein [Nonomuraea sp. C10]TXK40134.1 VOC family protein [Nonomuraea sp. C10]